VGDAVNHATVNTAQVLLEHHLKMLRLPTLLRGYDKVARQCSARSTDYPRYVLPMTELEPLDRERRATERLIQQARFPVVKSLESFEFMSIPSVNQALVLELARYEFVQRRENVLLGNAGTGKTHLALALGLAACQRGHRVGFTTAAALVPELMEAQDDKGLLRFQKQIATDKLLIVDELGVRTGVEDRRGVAVRAVQPALRARFEAGDQQPAFSGVDRSAGGRNG
jgi:DNA replication protein DnaC